MNRPSTLFPLHVRHLTLLHSLAAAPVVLLASVLSLPLLSACDDTDKWTTSPSALLSFSTDVVAFDTVITGQGSPQRTLLVFNRNSSGLRITSVALASGEASPFMANVDGEYLSGGRGEDFEVYGKDSLFVRLAVNLPETDSDEIQPYEDELVFTLESGVSQSVRLTADGLDVIRLSGVTVEQDQTLDARRPYLVTDSLVVAPNVRLTLPEGCTLMLHDATSLLVHGTLVAEGSLERPVTFRGDRTDHMFDYLPYDNTPNRWGGLHFFGDSHDNVLTQCDIHASDYGIVCDSTALDTDTPPLLTLTNCVLHNMGGTGLSLRHCVTEVTGTQISNTLGDCVSILGGAHTFVHCTLAQFYPFSSARGDALSLSNYAYGQPYPLLWCRFINCVIAGYADDVIMGSLVEEEGGQCDYLFKNSLLRTPFTQDDRFAYIVYDNGDISPEGKDHFVLFDATNFLYDFTPVATSAIRGLADSDYAQQYPVDRNGYSRLADGAPDAGAYEGQ